MTRAEKKKKIAELNAELRDIDAEFLRPEHQRQARGSALQARIEEIELAKNEILNA